MTSCFCSFQEFQDQTCIICNKEVKNSEESQTLTQKGCDTINCVGERLNTAVNAKPGNLVHKGCRISFTHKRNVQRKQDEAKGVISPRKRRHLNRDNLVLEPKCLFCDQGEQRLSKGRGTLIPVRTLKFQESVLEKCKHRSDSWGRKVQAKIVCVHDCVASDTVYHNICYSNFRSGCQIPKCFTDDEPQEKKGRPEDKIRLEAFHRVTQYLDSLDVLQVTVKDLTEVMETFLKDSGCEPYSPKYMKQKLTEHYGDEIVFAQSNKKADVITLKRTADAILRDFFNERRSSDLEAEKQRVIKVAASLIKK